jgi:hypothetical protein
MEQEAADELKLSFASIPRVVCKQMSSDQTQFHHWTATEKPQDSLYCIFLKPDLIFGGFPDQFH